MKKLFLPLTLLATGLFGSSLSVHAQADEPWYQDALKYNATISQQKSTQPKSSSSALKKKGSNSTGGRNIVNACDVMLNGSFEAQLAVPSHVNNMGGDYAGRIYGGTNRPDQLSNWYSPTAGSPDYFATNATTNSEVQPSNENSPYGSFTPYLGTSNSDGLEGAIGLYARQAYYDSNTNTDRDRTSEYAQIALAQSLPEGRYYIDFQVSLSHNTSTSLATNYGVNNGFGLVFTNTPSLRVTSSGDLTPTLYSRDFLLVPTNAQTVFNQSPIAQNAINYGITGAANWQRVSGQISSAGNLQYITAGLFNADPNNQIALPTGRPDLRNSYFFVDAIRVFKIPTAGSSVTIGCGNSTVVGEGCPIPGATYTWSSPGIKDLPVNSSSIQVTVTPKATTTYTLTVTLPDQSTYASSVTVTIGGALPVPTIVQDVAGSDPCQKYLRYKITNFNPNLTYTVNILSGRVNALPANPTTYDFRIKGGTGVTGGSFSVTVSGCGNTVTTSEYFVSYDCGANRVAQESTAYPNPAAESLILPEGVENATILDNNGKQVKSSSKSGKLDIRGIPDGLYNLQMRQDGKLINQRIQVKH